MLLRMRGITKTFDRTRALQGADFELVEGEIHGLLGANGAGKSTLSKIISGHYARDGGEMTYRGRDIRLRGTRDALNIGIAIVMQETSLVPDLTVLENIFLPELGRPGRLDYRKLRRSGEEILDSLGQQDALPFDLEVRRLSSAQKQLVEIAKALSVRAKLLIFDEPTASLSPGEVERLFDVMSRLRASGRGLVFVSHRLEEVFALTDRVTVLREGRTVMDAHATSGLTQAELIRAMVGAELGAIYTERHEDNAVTGPVALEVSHLQSAPLVHDVSFKVHKGEILGLYGLVGAGRTELARALIGDARILSGEVVLRGERVTIGSVPEAIRRHRLGYISEDRKAEGLILAHPIRSNIVIPIWRRIAGSLGLISRAAERRVAAPLAQRLEVKAPSIEQAVGKLSGGNQQKVSIAKWLAAGVDILIIDEPTVGIDIKTKTAIHELIGEITRSGVSVLLISSDMPEMITLADRILVMKDFSIRGEIENTRRYEAMSQAIMGHIHDGGDDEAKPREAGHG